MYELTEWDMANMGRLSKHEKSGFLVETKSGLPGRTYHSEPLVNEKVKVFLSDGRKMLCSPKSLKIKGSID